MVRFVCAMMLSAICAGRPAGTDAVSTPPPLTVAVSQNASVITPYRVFELTFQHTNAYRDPTWDVEIDCAFKSPDGTLYTVGGFFYGSSHPQTPVVKTWKDAQGRSRTDATRP